MRTYIEDFLKTYDYPTESAAALLDAYDRILADGEAAKSWATALELYEKDEHCDYDEIIRCADRAADLVGVHEFTTELLIFICMSRHLKTLYIERGIRMDFYERSMADLRYKLDECMLVYGVVGSFVAKWFVGFFNLTRFGMGRLQFEVIPFGKEYEKNGVHLTPESKVINVHIPRSGEPLTEEACREAYLMGKEFFKDEIEGELCPFVCSSWLLDPQFENFLPKTTNTYRFYKSFDIYEFRIDKDRRNLWRLFDTMEQNPDRLPADSSMRRTFIAHLKRGGKLGAGKGVLFV